MAKERGILMHARSVQNILAGRKTQTRRIVKGPELVVAHPAVIGWEVRDGWAHPQARNDAVKQSYVSTFPTALRCPYGQPGDRLWVRETWAVHYAEDDCGFAVMHEGRCAEAQPPRTFLAYRADEKPEDWDRMPWRPSLFMPRWASRITLEITDVRVERVQDISDADVLAEGVEPNWTGDLDGWDAAEHGFVGKDIDGVAENDYYYMSGQDAFKSLWDDTNGPGAWDRNDWVWALTFKRVEAANG